MVAKFSASFLDFSITFFKSTVLPRLLSASDATSARLSVPSCTSGVLGAFTLGFCGGVVSTVSISLGKLFRKTSCSLSGLLIDILSSKLGLPAKRSLPAFNFSKIEKLVSDSGSKVSPTSSKAVSTSSIDGSLLSSEGFSNCSMVASTPEMSVKSSSGVLLRASSNFLFFPVIDL